MKKALTAILAIGILTLMAYVWLRGVVDGKDQYIENILNPFVDDRTYRIERGFVRDQDGNIMGKTITYFDKDGNIISLTIQNISSDVIRTEYGGNKKKIAG